MIKIHLGCGFRHLPSPWVNCDVVPVTKPDFLFDFGQDDWPFAASSADEIAAFHSLEHSPGLLHVMVEAYRVLIPGGRFHIHVPHPRSDYFIGDPTHVMPFTPDTIALFSRDWCLHCQERSAANTPLALYLGVDFRSVSRTYHVHPRWHKTLLNDDMAVRDKDVFEFHVATYNNVIDSMEFVLERV